MKRNQIILLIILTIIAIILGIFAFCDTSQKEDTDKESTNSKVNESTTYKPENNREENESYSNDELSNIALDYFLKNTIDPLPKKEYSVGVSEEVIPKYQNQDMVVIEIRHINGSINSLDARYYINVYTLKGFDDMENIIDMNI